MFLDFFRFSMVSGLDCHWVDFRKLQTICNFSKWLPNTHSCLSKKKKKQAQKLSEPGRNKKKNKNLVQLCCCDNGNINGVQFYSIEKKNLNSNKSNLQFDTNDCSEFKHNFLFSFYCLNSATLQIVEGAFLWFHKWLNGKMYRIFGIEKTQFFFVLFETMPCEEVISLAVTDKTRQNKCEFFILYNKFFLFLWFIIFCFVMIF